MESSRLPAGAISLIKQGMDVTDGEQHISCSKDPQSRDDVTLPEDDKWFQGVLQARALLTTWGVMLTGPTLSTCPWKFLHFWGYRLVHTQPLCCVIVAIPVIMLREDCEAVHADNNFAAYDVLYNVR